MISTVRPLRWMAVGALAMLAACGGGDAQPSSVGTEGEGGLPIGAAEAVLESPPVDFAAERAIVLSGGGSVVVAGGWIRSGETARVATQVAALDRAGNRWTALPDLPEGTYAHAGAVLEGQVLVVAADCPDGADVFRWTEQCSGDRVLTLATGGRSWDIHQLPRSELMSTLSTDTAGLSNGKLVMIPQSIERVGAVVYDPDSTEFSIVEAPSADGEALVPAGYCVTEKDTFIAAEARTQEGGEPTGGTVWTLDGDAWRGPLNIDTGNSSDHQGTLCSPNGFVYLGTDRSTIIRSEGTQAGPGVDAEVRSGFVAARSSDALVASSSDGQLVAVAVPDQLGDDNAVVASAQRASTLDFLVRADPAGRTHRIVTVEIAA